MRLKIFAGETHIGDAEVFALDPLMCVAIAKFFPTRDYHANRHATVIDGERVGDRTDVLRLEMAEGLAVRCEAISIQDYPSLHERQVDLWGVFEPSYDELFKEHPSYSAYYSGAAHNQSDLP
jgi:hypothetical protein